MQRYYPAIAATEQMTLSNITASRFDYIKLGSIVAVSALFECTTGGTPSYGILFDLPIPRSNMALSYGGGAPVKDGGAYGAGWYEIAGNSVIVRRVNGGSFGLGTFRGFKMNFWYFI